MSDYFSDLLKELGTILKLPLTVDKANACSILKKPLTIQLELDFSQENLVFFSKIIELPPGKFRENVLCSALKNNGLPDPRPGIFGYIGATNHLALYQIYPVHMLNGTVVSGLLGSFFDLGVSWYKAIEQGQPGISSPLIETGKLPPRGIRL